MKTQTQLVNNIIGQLEGIKRMLEQEKDCFQTIIQMKAVRSAVDNVMQKFIEENFIHCSSLCKKTEDKERLEKLITTLIKK